jgi:HlyD family secretion protein
MAAAVNWLARLAPRRPWIIAGAILLALLAVWFLFLRGDGDGEPYRTASADRGRITRVVSATGTLQPLVSVNVGSTVSGLVETVDVDFNSTVTAGQVLARLEPDTFQQRVDQARANQQQALADLAVATSDYERYAKLDRAGFASGQLMSQQRAARARAQAAVAQTSAALETARTDLDRSIIRSPINGVVVDRQINKGQSVAASFQAPTLFVIAQDLSRLQANITVDEADIGQVREGMSVRFTVDAFPDEDFEGRVSQVRQQGVDTNGVVSYTVVVQADNPGRRLLPGMTANAEIVVEETAQVARIPNSALRFQPADEQLRNRAREMAGQGQGKNGRERAGEAIASEGRGGRGGGRAIEQLSAQLQLTSAQQEQARAAIRQAMQAGAQSAANPGERRGGMRLAREAALRAIEPTLTPEQRVRLAQLRGNPEQSRQTPTRTAVIWVLRNNRPHPVRVQLGVSDDSYSELRGGELQPSDKIIIGGGPRDEREKQKQQGPMGGPNIRIRGA